MSTVYIDPKPLQKILDKYVPAFEAKKVAERRQESASGNVGYAARLAARRVADGGELALDAAVTAYNTITTDGHSAQADINAYLDAAEDATPTPDSIRTLAVDSTDLASSVKSWTRLTENQFWKTVIVAAGAGALAGGITRKVIDAVQTHNASNADGPIVEGPSAGDKLRNLFSRGTVDGVKSNVTSRSWWKSLAPTAGRKVRAADWKNAALYAAGGAFVASAGALVEHMTATYVATAKTAKLARGLEVEATNSTDELAAPAVEVGYQGAEGTRTEVPVQTGPRSSAQVIPTNDGSVGVA